MILKSLWEELKARLIEDDARAVWMRLHLFKVHSRIIIEPSRMEMSSLDVVGNYVFNKNLFC